MALPDPERARRWYETLLPIAQQGGPLLTLMLAVMMALAVWYLLGVLAVNRAFSVDLLQKLHACQDAKVELARQCSP